MPQTNRPGACPLAALWLSLLALLLLPTAAHAAPRVALLIGNQAYTQGGLRYPAQDVGHIKAALLDIGFQSRDVVVLLDADQKAVKRALSAFGERARGAEVAFLYYSGHATQARGQNWLIPIGAEIRNEADYEIEAVSAQGALAQLQEAAPALSIVVLDACRDNPVAVTKSGTKGLGRMDAGASTVLAYATSPNDTAADNGLYAQVLAAQLRMPGKEILDVFRDTGTEVRKRTSGTAKPQAPRLSEVDVPRRFYLAGLAPTPTPAREPDAVPPPGPALELADLQLQARQEQQAAQRQAEQAARMQKDFDAVAALSASPALQAQAWQRFLAAWPASPVGNAQAADLRRQAQQRLTSAQAQAAAGSKPDAVDTAGAALRPGQVVKDCAQCPELVVIPAGEFLMGSPADEPGRFDPEGPQHRVKVGSFLAGRYEVTFEEWDACVAGGGCRHRPGDEGWGRGRRPVINVSWEDAQQYVMWLSVQTGKGYRLLSEAEWEYTARAGTSGPFWTGPTISPAQANFDGTETYNGSVKGEWRQKTLPVGSLGANPFGLHDTAGNAREWVQDVWHDNYDGAPGDGSAWMSGGEQSRRVLRGGSWYINAKYLRSANRGRNTPDNRGITTGFRIARTS